MNILDLYEEFDNWVDYLTEYTSADEFAAKDICQEVFLKIYEKYGEEELPFANTIANMRLRLKRQFLMYKRTDRNYKNRNYNYMNNFLNRSKHRREDFDELKILFSLVPEYESILTDFYIKGYSYEKIANRKGTSIAAVKSKLQRARAASRNTLHKLLPLLKCLELEANKRKKSNREDYEF